MNNKYSLFVVPPNVTGDLHLGHALMISIQDSIVRWKRKRGFDIEFFFGTDHAGISTETVVKKTLEDQGIDVNNLSKRELVKHIWDFVEIYDNRIRNQIKRLNTVIDWDKHLFTLNEDYSEKVLDSFVKLYNDGLIYLGKYPINFCPNCETSLSDLEVEEVKEERELYVVEFESENQKKIPVLFRDLDEVKYIEGIIIESDKYHLSNSVIYNPYTKKKLKTIVDEDLYNLEIGDSHKDYYLAPLIPTRRKEQFKKLNYRSEYTQENLNTSELINNNFNKVSRNVKTKKCERCSTEIIEKITEQWFLKMDGLAKELIKRINNNKVNFYPLGGKEQAIAWLEEIEDWCISRQISWGHRLPVWSCDDCKQVHVSQEEINQCPYCESYNICASTDVLDTWFSSAHWYFSNYGWPEDLEKIKKDYPLPLIETGHDILFFWVLRMMMLSIYHTNKLPSKEVLLHGLVLDSKGKKMSKSRGNTIDVLNILDEFDYGEDVIRLGLLKGCEPGLDVKISKEEFKKINNLLEEFNGFLELLPKKVSKYDSEKIDNDMANWLIKNIIEIRKIEEVNIKNYNFKSYVERLLLFIEEIVKYKDTILSNNENPDLISIILYDLVDLIEPYAPKISSKWCSLISEGNDHLVKNVFSKFNKPIFNSDIANLIHNKLITIETRIGKKFGINVFVKLTGDNKLEEDFLELYGKEITTTTSFNFLNDQKNKREEELFTIPTEAGGIKISLKMPYDHKALYNLQEMLKKELAPLKQELSSINKRIKDKGFIENASSEKINEDYQRKEQLDEKVELYRSTISKTLKLLGEENETSKLVK